MSRYLTRIICAIFFVFGTQVSADIAMVTSTLAPLPKRALPELPQHEIQTFSLVSERGTIAEDVVQYADINEQSDISAFGEACSIRSQVLATDGAMLSVSVAAPCLPHTEVQVFDGNLTYTATLSLTGTVTLSFPAMATTTELTITTENGVHSTSIKHPDFKNYARIALLAPDDISLGATYLGTEQAIYQTAGLQVFSVDLREAERSRLYRLTLRKEITAESCNRSQDMILHRFVPGKDPQKQSLRLVGSNCARAGGILELKNIVADLKIASN